LAAAPLLPDLSLDERASLDEVRAYLSTDRLGSAYALADLDGEAEVARWWLARRAGEAVAATVVVESLPFRPTFAMGEPGAIGDLFRDALREQRVVVNAPLPSRSFIEQQYRFERVDRMERMVVDAGSFQSNAARAQGLVRLGPEHLDDLIDLYGHVSRSYFTPDRIARQIYFGVFVSGSLVAAAGTHVQAARSGLAAVGNVLTRPAYRSRGMATAVTAAVTEVALEKHRDVVLNVRSDNTPALRVYRGLGYRTHSLFLEGPAVRRAGWERLTQKLFGSNEGGAT